MRIIFITLFTCSLVCLQATIILPPDHIGDYAKYSDLVGDFRTIKTYEAWENEI